MVSTKASPYLELLRERRQADESISLKHSASTKATQQEEVEEAFVAHWTNGIPAAHPAHLELFFGTSIHIRPTFSRSAVFHFCIPLACLAEIFHDV